MKSYKVYDYTTGEIDGSAEYTEQISFPYENTAWLDIASSLFDNIILYDESGNPVKMGDCDVIWTNGRQLSKIINAEYNVEVLSYTYDENGIRTSKTYCGETTYYTTIDGNITSQYTIDENGNKKDEIEFIYDSSDEVIAAVYKNKTYYYVKNVMGDVESIVNQDGKVVSYNLYSAYGENKGGYQPLFTDYTDKEFAENINPIQYRSYYHDEQMDMYYLQSRYYLSGWGRFLNADLPEFAQQQKSLNNGTNLFAYCCNDPVNRIDPTGHCYNTRYYSTKFSYTDGFKTQKAAVKNFDKKNFCISKYIQFEMCVLIFKYKENKKVRYGYTGYSFGGPHSCKDPLKTMKYYSRPQNSTIVAIAHTHPFPHKSGGSDNLSYADLRYSKNNKIDMYVVGSNNIYYHKYTDPLSTKYDTKYSRSLGRRKLDSKEKKKLKNLFQDDWNKHIKTKCGFPCKLIEWPVEE